MFKHNLHPKRSRRDALDITSDLSEHPNVCQLSDTCNVQEEVELSYM